MDSEIGLESRVNSYALVSYLPDPLGSFLTQLRQELLPQCSARSHLTLLPPRPLSASAPDAWNALKVHLADFPAFGVELGEVKVFPGTQVIYLAIKAGYQELLRMHDRLNVPPLDFQEPFPFHPHVTLAQDLGADNVAQALELSVRRWSEYRHSHWHTVDRLTFVQNTLENRWTDLASLDLASHAVK